MRLRGSPEVFAEEILLENPWSKERQIMRAVAENDRVAIGSGHSVGKTYTLASLVLWFLITHPHSKVITTAPTERQVRDLLWSEIATKYRKVKSVLGGRIVTKRLEFVEDWFAVGFKSKDYDANAFQGYHARYVMVVFDEASGITKALWDAARGLMTGQIVKWIAAGNRIDPLAEFEKCFRNPGWHKIIISSYDSPNVTGERYIPELATQGWIDQCARDWGMDSPLFRCRVKGECPSEGLDTLIPLSYLEAIKAEPADIKEVRPLYGGLDVAGEGSDLSVFQILDSRGQHIEKYTWARKKTTETEGRAKKIFLDRGLAKLAVDATGIGQGVSDALCEAIPGKIVPYIGAESPSCEEAYANRKTEVWNWVLQDLEAGELTAIQDIGYLFADITGLHQKINRSGKMQVESKIDYKRRLGRSPDDGEAFVLANMARKYATLGIIEAKHQEEHPDEPDLTLPEQFGDLNDMESELTADLKEFE